MTSSSDRRDGPPPGARPSYARFIPREELQSFSAWTPGAIGGAAGAPAGTAPAAPPPDPRQEAEREAERQRAEVHAARQAGYQEGYRDGLAALEGFKQHYAAQVTGQVAAVVQSLDGRLDELEKHLAERITGVVLELARQAVRTEITLQPEHIVPVANEALGVLLMSARHVTLRLNPEDQSLVAQGCAEALTARHARLVADATIERGGCVIESDIGVVDAQVSTRWMRAAQSLGDNGDWE